jgi:hypothetical protein
MNQQSQVSSSKWESELTETTFLTAMLDLFSWGNNPKSKGMVQ